MEDFNLKWAKSSLIHIKRHALELTKRQRAMNKLGVPCKDALKVTTYVTNMYVCGIFKDMKMIHGGNTAALHGWWETTQYFDKLWTDRTAVSARGEGLRPFKSAALLVDGRRLSAAQSRDALLLLD